MIFDMDYEDTPISESITAAEASDVDEITRNVTDLSLQETATAKVQPALCESQSAAALDRLPPELIQHIGGFLRPEEIVQSLTGTNRLMHSIFAPDEYFRVRLKKKWPASYPIIPDRVPRRAIWRKRCRERELHYDLFRNGLDGTAEIDKRIFGHGEGGYVGGDVNAVCFSGDGKFLCTGGRDRHVIVWDLEKMKKFPSPGTHTVAVDGSESAAVTAGSSAVDCQTVLHTHGGWVWSLRSHGSLLSSGAWDCTINIADLNHSTDATSPKTTLKTSASVTCHKWDNNTIIAGTFIGGVTLFDPRSGPGPVINRSQSHHQAVLGIHMSGPHVVLVGSDKKVQKLDLRANEFVDKKPIPNGDYGTQLCVQDEHIWVGTKKGQVLVYDLSNFQFVDNLTAAIGHTTQITGMHCDSGHILTCALDRTAKMRHPTRNADLIWQYQADAGFTAMDFAKDCTLALAWGPCVGVFWPKPNAL